MAYENTFLKKNPKLINENKLDLKNKLDLNVISKNIEGGYTLFDSFENIIYSENLDVEDKIINHNLISNIENENILLEKEYGVKNIIEYKQKFEKLIHSLEQDKIYKILLYY